MITMREGLAEIEGLTFVDYLLVSGGELLLYFGDVVRQSPLRTEWLLSVSSAWRVEEKQRVLAGSLSEPDLTCRVLEEIRGSTVVSASFANGTEFLDIHIDFSNGVFLLTFAHSVEDEVWDLRSAGGLRVGVGPHHSAYRKQLTHSEIQGLEKAAEQASQGLDR